MTDWQPSTERGDTSSHGHLEEIFVEVTGTDELVEEQSQSASAPREVPLEVEGQSQTLSEYLSMMVRDDGLAETFGDPDETSRE